MRSNEHYTKISDLPLVLSIDDLAKVLGDRQKYGL